MDSNELKFDLMYVIRVGYKWRKKILVFAIIAAIAMGIGLLFVKNKYKGYAQYFPASMAISGRYNIFREENEDRVDFFGLEDEVDRVFVIGNSSPVMSHLIHKFQMAKHYDIDVKNDPSGMQKVYKKFVKKYSLRRTGMNHLEVCFEDEDSQLAADIVNESINETQAQYRAIYDKVNAEIVSAYEKRLRSMDTTLTLLTDSVIKLRVKYNQYALLSPSRKNNIITPNGSGEPFARGLEEIQNVEELKDRFVTDRAKFIGLSNEFKTGLENNIPLLYVVQWATPGGEKSSPFRTIQVAITFLIALVFGILLCVSIEQFQKNKDQFTKDV